MKKLVILFMATLLITSSAYAATDKIGEGMGEKAVRGAVNLVTGIIELPVQVYKGYDKGFEPIENTVFSKTVGTIFGLFRGVGHAAGRMSWGAIELFSFWAANHEDNEGVGIPLDAEYAWETGEQYSIFEPSFEEGIKPIGRKLTRGLADTFLGIAEVPGQAMKGSDEGNFFLGLGRGVWFWLSREVYGISSIFTCIIPNPKDNPGYSLHEDMPWEALAEETD